MKYLKNITAIVSIILTFLFFPASALADESFSNTSAKTNNDVFCQTAETYNAISFTPASSEASISGTISLAYALGSPTLDITLDILADSGGHPSGSSLASGSISHTLVSSSYADVAFSTITFAFVGGTTYWLRLGCGGSISGTDYYGIGLNATTVNPEQFFFGGSWLANTFARSVLNLKSGAQGNLFWFDFGN